MAPCPFYWFLTLGIVVFAFQMGTIGAQDATPAKPEDAKPEGGSEAKPGDEKGEIGGRTVIATTADEAKHVVSLRLKSDPAQPICAGSLIKSNVVLTAAQCLDFDEPEKLTFVVMGSLKKAEDKDALKSDISKVVPHPKFNRATAENDIALVFLKNSVPAKTKNVHPIDLNRKALKDGEKCKVTGWGIAGATPTEVLNSVEEPFVEDAKCAALAKLKTKVTLSKSLLCAGVTAGEGNPCIGDGGGPLVCNKLLSGIVSHGLACTVNDAPEIYTDVSFYAAWIDKELKKGGGSQPGKSIGSNCLRPTMPIVLLAIGLCLWQAIQKCNIPFI